MEKTNSLGLALRSARKRAGKTVPEVSAAIGRGQTCVYRWEWGKSHPRHSDLEKLAGLYGLTVGQLVDGGELQGTGS